MINQPLNYKIWCEGKWFVSQCLDIDIASQGETEQEALDSLREAIELYFEPPTATRPPMHHGPAD